MGAGYHGGFGSTHGAVAAAPTYVGRGEGENLKYAAEKIKPEPGYTDVVVHGGKNDVSILHNNEWVKLDHRRLTNLLKHDKEYNKTKSIRLISCSTGAHDGSFAQNLANKLGVPVKAPTDTLWVHPSGKMTIGSSPFKNTGKWIIYKPYKRK